MAHRKDPVGNGGRKSPRNKWFDTMFTIAIILAIAALIYAIALYG